MIPTRRKRLYIYGLALIVGMSFFLLSNVPTEVTIEDKRALPVILKGAYNNGSKATSMSFNEQIQTIKDIFSVIRQYGSSTPFRHYPPGKTREPSDFLNAPSLVCHTITRSLEKALVHRGFEIRHIFVLETKGEGIWSVFKSNIESHAIVEVKTERGWLALDPHFNQIYFSGQVTYGVDQIDQLHLPKHPIFKKRHLIVYGLYSRHGKQYPPFIRIPDINWVDFLTISNFLIRG